jgi:hypothetical protein
VIKQLAKGMSARCPTKNLWSAEGAHFETTSPHHLVKRSERAGEEQRLAHYEVVQERHDHDHGTCTCTEKSHVDITKAFSISNLPKAAHNLYNTSQPYKPVEYTSFEGRNNTFDPDFSSPDCRRG